MKINDITNESTKLDESLATAAIGGVKSAWQGLKQGFIKGWREKRYTDAEINSPAFQAAIRNAELGKPVNTHILKPKVATPKAVEPKVATPKAVEPKVATPKAVEPKVATPKAVEPKVATPKAVTPKADPKPKAVTPKADPKPKAVEPKAVEPKAVEPKAVEPKAVEPKALSQNDYKIKFGTRRGNMGINAKLRNMKPEELEQAILKQPPKLTHKQKLKNIDVATGRASSSLSTKDYKITYGTTKDNLKRDANLRNMKPEELEQAILKQPGDLTHTQKLKNIGGLKLKPGRKPGTINKKKAAPKAVTPKADPKPKAVEPKAKLSGKDYVLKFGVKRHNLTRDAKLRNMKPEELEQAILKQPGDLTHRQKLKNIDGRLSGKDYELKYGTSRSHMTRDAKSRNMSPEELEQATRKQPGDLTHAQKLKNIDGTLSTKDYKITYGTSRANLTQEAKYRNMSSEELEQAILKQPPELTHKQKLNNIGGLRNGAITGKDYKITYGTTKDNLKRHAKSRNMSPEELEQAILKQPGDLTHRQRLKNIDGLKNKKKAAPKVKTVAKPEVKTNWQAEPPAESPVKEIKGESLADYFGRQTDANKLAKEAREKLIDSLDISDSGYIKGTPIKDYTQLRNLQNRLMGYVNGEDMSSVKKVSDAIKAIRKRDRANDLHKSIQASTSIRSQSDRIAALNKARELMKQAQDAVDTLVKASPIPPHMVNK